MHDPDVVAHEIRRPWPQRSALSATGSREDGVRWQIRHHHTCIPACREDPDWPHPSGAFPWWKPSSYRPFWRLAGRDYYWPPMIVIWHAEPHGADALSICRHRYQDRHVRWRLSRGWKWHIHHYRLQFPPLQHARRWLLTRCAWCGGPSRKGDLVNCANSWSGPRGHWWQGEPELYHRDCQDVHRAHGLCQCFMPQLDARAGYGNCVRCGKFYPWQYRRNEADRLLNTLGPGERIPASMRPALEAVWAQNRAEAREQGW